jgi:hypothetical protein
MARTFPWHSAHEAVYHNNTLCSAGRAANIAGARDGSHGKRLCRECEQLNQVGSSSPSAPNEFLRRSA